MENDFIISKNAYNGKSCWSLVKLLKGQSRKCVFEKQHSPPPLPIFYFSWGNWLFLGGGQKYKKIPPSSFWQKNPAIYKDEKN